VWAATIEKYATKQQMYVEDDWPTVYAIKEMNKSIIVSNGALMIANNEVKLMNMLPKSPFIVNLWHAFQNKHSAFLLMDYAP